MKGGFVRSGLRFHDRDKDGRQTYLWEDRVVLDESSMTPCVTTQYHCAKRHCVSWPIGVQASTFTSG